MMYESVPQRAQLPRETARRSCVCNRSLMHHAAGPARTFHPQTHVSRLQRDPGFPLRNVPPPDGFSVVAH